MHKIHRLIITDINEDCFVSKLFIFVIIDAWFFPFFIQNSYLEIIDPWIDRSHFEKELFKLGKGSLTISIGRK